MEDIRVIVGNNLKTIRKDRHMTLEQLSEATGISKSMLGEIERSATNPTISVLWKIATGLKIPFSSLMKKERETVNLIKSDAINPTIEGEGYKIASVMGFDEDKGFEIYMEEFEPGSRVESKGHDKGVEEYIFAIDGTLSVDIEEKTYEISAGDVMNFAAEGPHTFYNAGEKTVKAFVIIYYDKK